MAPSNMLLCIGQIQGYNNEIQIATAGMGIGPNVSVNDSPVPPAPLPIRGTLPAHHEPPAGASLPAPVAATTAAEAVTATQHQDEKQR
jgi:hypothetical protein